MTAIFSRVRLNARQVAAMVVFVMLASLAQMVAPALVSRMIDGVAGNDQKTIIVLAIATVVSMFPDAYACMKRIGEVSFPLPCGS